MIETAIFVCSICGESSTDICVYCTKDTCTNHRCLRCLRCSDCCECEVPLTAGGPEAEPAYTPFHAEPVPEPMLQPEPMAEAEPEPSPEPLADVEPQPEFPGVAAIVLPEPDAAPTVEQAATEEELVRALPELFAPETEPSKEEASEKPDADGPEPDRNGSTG